MSGNQTSSKTDVVLQEGSEQEIRYVLDFGPGGAKSGEALKTIEDGLANLSKYAGAIMIRRAKGLPKTSKGYLTAVEIKMTLYEIPDPTDEVSRFVLGWNTTSPESGTTDGDRLVLSAESRAMVSRVVRSALAYTLGDNGRDVVLSKLQLDYGFGFSEVTDFPGRFVELLNEILQGGARYVEERMLQELRSENKILQDCQTLKDAVMKLVLIDTSSGK